MAAPREALLARIIDHVAHHGISDVSLRELASAVGTSHRMLLYHFGDRAGLVAAIVATIEAQQRTLLESLGTESPDPRDVILAQWQQLSQPELRPFTVLFFEVLALALQKRPGTHGFLEELTSPWLDLAQIVGARLGAQMDRTDALLGIAVLRGLILEALVSGDVDPSTAALHRFLDMWNATKDRTR